ncbi:MAG: alpha-mannosidase [Calothrix sp. MO_167.B12]|nr:alpha-mannosidase [Calothrix sp. MO_167.B12]
MTTPVSPANTEIISDAIEKLRSYSQVDIYSGWRYCADAVEARDVTAANIFSWNIPQLNNQGNITWNGGKKVLWLGQHIVIPTDIQGYQTTGLSLRLALVWWADNAQVYVNGKLAAEGDLFDFSPRVLLEHQVNPGDEFIVTIRLVSPGHCDGALMSSRLVYQSTDDSLPEPGFVADELAVLQQYLKTFAPEKLEILAAMVKDIDGVGSSKAEIDSSLTLLRDRLIQTNIFHPQSKIYLLGHAHLDMAWLWRVSETWKAAQNTFESVLRLQKDFPELIFCHSTPALYAWIEKHRPDLFEGIQAAIDAGVWEVVGSFWIEPDLNLISGESIVRQLLYGQCYGIEKFGKLSTVVWVPDSFGFCWTLPQFLQQAGVEYFVTQKLRWNDTTRFPHDFFWWRSPDGSQVLSLMSSAIGEGIDPMKMAAYDCEWQSQTGLKSSLWLAGVGDHGGGPTRDMLEIARRWQNSPHLPPLEFITAEKYLQQITPTQQLPVDTNGTETTSPSASPSPHHPILPITPSPHHPITPSPTLPTWNDELYLEFHRGCYTSHADQKRWNRNCENLLYQAELFASFANITSGITYPQKKLETAWKQVLFHQFHDILPGTSITEVYQDALPEWQQVERVGTEILQQSLDAIASQINLPEPPHPHSLPVVVFNPLNWERSEVVAVSLPEIGATHSAWQIIDTNGQPQTSQLGADGKLLFLAKNIPSVGYVLFWLSPQEIEKYNTSPHYENTILELPSQPGEFSAPGVTLENEYLRAIVDEETGNLASVFDKINHREIIADGAGNQLQAFQDSGQYWDAWNIDPNYQKSPLPSAALESIEVLESGSVQTRVRVMRTIGKSEFCCDYILQSQSPILKVATTVDWQESHVLVKAAFPLNLQSEFATYEIPCGAIRRSTKPQTPAETAKWEVPALRWADLTEEGIESPSATKNDYGVSLLNDCKYGYDSQPNLLRLTLLRSPNWPDLEADKGRHEFTYALYPHTGNWQAAQTVRRGYELNIPLQIAISTLPQPGDKKALSPIGKFLDLSAGNLILMAFKQAEENPQQWILRCYECQGETADLSLQSDLGLSLGNSVDLLERSLSQPENLPAKESITIKPWKITSFELKQSVVGG